MERVPSTHRSTVSSCTLAHQASPRDLPAVVLGAMRLRDLALVMSLSLAHSSRADISVAALSRAPASADAKTLLAEWRACPDIARVLSLDFDTGDLLKARPIVGGIEGSYDGLGKYYDGYDRLTSLRLRHGHCDAVGTIDEGPKRSIVRGVRALGVGGAQPPSLATIAAWRAAVIVDDSDRPELSASRALMALASDEDKRVPRRYRGRPMGSPAALWTPDALPRAGLARARWQQGSFAAIAHAAIATPERIFVSDRWEVWETRFAADEGGMLAVYDVEHDTHRWLWGASADDTRRAHFRVLAIHGDYLVFAQETFADTLVVSINLDDDSRRYFQRLPGKRVRSDGDGIAIDDERLSWATVCGG
jgi:hypothetical protein